VPIRLNISARLNEPEDFDADTPFYEKHRRFRPRLRRRRTRRADRRAQWRKRFQFDATARHHATRDRAMGFCYLNNVAIAALEAAATGAKRVAVFDFDVHHGNGTEAILLNRPGTVFFSIHLFPCYPGTGSANAGNTVLIIPSNRACRARTTARARPRAGRFEKIPARPGRRVRRIRRLRARPAGAGVLVVDDF